MNCVEDECVCSVKKENNLGYYRLHTIWRKDRFFINIASKNGSWRGEMTPSDVAKMSAQLELEPQSYINQCKEALTHHDGQPGVVYAVENGSFSWKRVEDEDSGIKIKMGSVMLEPTKFEDTIQNLVTAALNCNKNLQEKLKEITEEKRIILENRNKLLEKLNELTKAKESMENDLYARFILLNNAKKRKIHELENLLEEKYKKPPNTLPRNSENPYEIDTDTNSEEDISIKSVNKVKRKSGKNIKKNFREKCQLVSDAEEKKEDKNRNGVVADEKTGFRCSENFSVGFPEASTSTTEAENQGKVLHQMSVTKDELYDFFYGEL